MELARLTSPRCQLTLPREVRQSSASRKGTRLFYEHDGRMVIDNAPKTETSPKRNTMTVACLRVVCPSSRQGQTHGQTAQADKLILANIRCSTR